MASLSPASTAFSSQARADLRVSRAMLAAQQGVRERDLAGGDALFGRDLEPLRGGRGVLLDAVASRVKAGDVMRRNRIALLGRLQKPMGRFSSDLRPRPRRSRIGARQ